MGDHYNDPVGDRGRDLVLVQKNGKGDKVLQVVLSNVLGQKYTFGSKYPGAREGEEFVFCRLGAEGLVEPTHCTIRVDEGGNYWIEKASSTAKTFVNLEAIAEPRPLKDGDIVSLGIPRKYWFGSSMAGPLFLVDCRLPDSKTCELENLKEIGIKEETEVLHGIGIDESPFDNELVLSTILDYLPFYDLKNSRLVCKKWNQEGSKILQKKGKVSFNFDGAYGKPQNSTIVYRYLHEMEGLKIRNVNINLSPTELFFFAPGEPGEKVLDDLRKLLSSSHNFSNLVLHYYGINNDSSFSLLHLILEKLGPKLLELELHGSIQFLPSIIPPLPQMTHLKKLTTYETSRVLVECQKWITLLVPIFQANLEHFTCCEVNVSTLYLEEFLKHKMPKLEEFVIGDDIAGDKSSAILTLLLQLKTPLTNLRLGFWFLSEENNAYLLLEELLWRNAQSLKHLALDIGNVPIKLPRFPKLEELHFLYFHGTTVNWESGEGLKYNEHFPSLRKLKLELNDEEPFNLAGDGVFNSFFPEGRDFPCETVTQLYIPSPMDPEEDSFSEFTLKKWRAIEQSYKKFQERMTKIKTMFPKVEKIHTDDSYSIDYDYFE